MFCGNQKGFRLHSVHIGNGLFSHIVFVLPKGPVVDHRVVGIVVDIDHGGEVSVKTGALDLAGYFLPHPVEQGVILNGSQRHLEGIADGVVQPQSQSPFGIDGA